MKLGDIINRLMPMLDDAQWAEEALENDDNQFTRRAYVRSVFAMIEGTVWALKHTALHVPTKDGKPRKLSIAEYSLLSEKSFDLDNKGYPKEQIKYLKLTENVKFTFRIVSKIFGIEIDLGVGSNGWNDFVSAQKIRNRITHPKTLSDYAISDSEISACKNACAWFNKLAYSFFDGIVAGSSKRVPNKSQERTE